MCVRSRPANARHAEALANFRLIDAMWDGGSDFGGSAGREAGEWFGTTVQQSSLSRKVSDPRQSVQQKDAGVRAPGIVIGV